MKKALVGILMVSLFTLPAMIQAQTEQNDNQAVTKVTKSEQTPSGSNSFQGRNYQDKDGDGVCDNFASRKPGVNGARFVDKDGDGVCDNRGTMRQGRGNGYGKGACRGHRHGKGKGYCRQVQPVQTSTPDN